MFAGPTRSRAAPGTALTQIKKERRNLQIFKETAHLVLEEKYTLYRAAYIASKSTAFHSKTDNIRKLYRAMLPDCLFHRMMLKIEGAVASLLERPDTKEYFENYIKWQLGHFGPDAPEPNPTPESLKAKSDLMTGIEPLYNDWTTSLHPGKTTLSSPLDFVKDVIPFCDDATKYLDDCELEIGNLAKQATVCRVRKGFPVSEGRS